MPVLLIPESMVFSHSVIPLFQFRISIFVSWQLENSQLEKPNLSQIRWSEATRVTRQVWKLIMSKRKRSDDDQVDADAVSSQVC